MSELCNAVERLDLVAVQRLLQEGHDPNGVRRLWRSDENDDEAQPTRPLKMVVFRASDAMHGSEQQQVLADIARSLLAAGADPGPAQSLARQRYGDDCGSAEGAWPSVAAVMAAKTGAPQLPAAGGAAAAAAPGDEQASAAAVVASGSRPGGGGGGGGGDGSPYPDSFTVMSYNVLIPNSKDGWWIYKMYRCDTPDEHTEWNHRRGLLERQILDARPDILCLQEMAGWSIDEDWVFLDEAGYDSAVYKKDRMRPGTFWRRDRFELWGTEKESVCHTDRMVVTLLKPRWPEYAARIGAGASAEGSAGGGGGAPAAAAAGDNTPPLIAVVGGHLKAGFDSAKRRLQQLFKGLDALRKMLVRVHKTDKLPSRVGVVVCGDFNSGGRTATRELLTKGVINADFREFDDGADDGPTAMGVTSKTKKHEFGPFRDTYVGPVKGQEAVPAEEELACRYSMICRELVPMMLHGNRELTPRLLAALNEMFDTLSEDTVKLTQEEENEWLIRINRRLDRGAEMRAAKELRQADNTAQGGSPVGELWRQDFIKIYTDVVEHGGFAAMDYDVRVVLDLPGGLKEFDFSGDEGTAAYAAAHAAVASPSKAQRLSKAQRISKCARTQAKADGAGHVFCARYDFIYAQESEFDVVARMPAADADRMERLLCARETLPNSNHPSDHLPLRVALRFRQ